MYRYECPICDESVEDVSEIKERAKEHVKQHHRSEIEEKFRRGYTGNGCGNGCGYDFPTSPEDHPGLICPNCGRDHFEWYAGIQGYISVEKID